MPRMSAHSREAHVRINGAVFYAYHGVSKDERRIGAQYEINVDVTCDIARAAKSDRLQDAVNYEAVYARVQKIATTRRYKLMESIASRIVDDLFAGFPAALEIAVCIRKLNAPVNGVVHSTEVALGMARAQWKKLH